MDPFVSVVVPVRNGQRTISDCVMSLLRMDYPPERREILVVDNSSSDGTARTVRSHPVTLLQEHQRGAAAARNAGILASRGQILAFTDADCIVTVQWARELVRAFADERVGGVEGETVDYLPTTRVERYIARRRPFSYEARRFNPLAPFVITANVAFRRDVFDRIGLFDTRFAGAGGEDIDFTWRFVGETELALRHSPRAIVFHRNRATAWPYFQQQARNARALATLRAKYPERLPWSWRQEMRAWGVLVSLVTPAVREAAGGVRSTGGPHDDVQLALLRRLAVRLGFLQGTLAVIRRRAWGRLASMRRGPVSSTIRR